jgi:uncharacterized protein with PhoU and TrkA domain
MHATVDAERRIALGPEIGAEPGDEVFLERRGDEWVLRVAKLPMGLCRDGDVLVHRGVSTKSAEEVLEETRNERFDQLSEGLPK